MIENNILILDLETNSLDTDYAEIKVFGAYDPYLDKYFIYKWTDENIAKVVKLIHSYNIIITFNGINYDLPILKRFGVPIDFKHIDVYNIFKHKRTQLINPKGFDSYSMKALVLQLGLDSVGKGEIDYAIFKKDKWNAQEQALIITYLKQDLLLTWKLWKYLVDKFEVFAKYIPEKDRILYKHITTSLPLLAYKIICHGARVVELYDEMPKAKNFPQPIVTKPRRHIVDNGVLLKFNPLYAHIIMQFNLASTECECCQGSEGKFHGRNYYIVKGYYCQKNFGRIEKFLQRLYTEAKNSPEIALVSNIVSDNIYEVFTNPLFYSTYNPNAAYDMYSLAKQQLKLLVRKFEDAGFLIVYIDVDEVFIQVPNDKTMPELLHSRDSIIEFMRSKMPFPSETFNLELCAQLSYLRFFKNPNPADPFLRKGEYVYVTDTGLVGNKGVSENIVKRILSEAISGVV